MQTDKLSQEEIQARNALKLMLVNKSTLNVDPMSFMYGAEDMFNLLWSYVKEGYQRGLERGAYNNARSVEFYAMTEGEYLESILTELKNKADERH